MAQGEDRLGCLERPFAGRRADRAAHSRRHSGARPARPQSDFHRRCSSLSVCARTARRHCSRSRAWAAKAPRHGARSSTISSSAVCDGPSSSSSTARQGLKRQLPPSGTACRCRGARYTSIATCSPVRPERLYEEIGADYNDMIYAATPEEIEARRKAFIRRWRLKHRAVADSLEEAGNRLVYIHSSAAKSEAQRAHNKRNRAAARRVQAKDQNSKAVRQARADRKCRRDGCSGRCVRVRSDQTLRKVDGWQTLLALRPARPYRPVKVDLDRLKRITSMLTGDRATKCRTAFERRRRDTDRRSVARDL